MWLFGQRPTVTLVDPTNTYFECEAKTQPKARRGRLKEQRPDCGMAWNDGQTEIVAAELSSYGGNTWWRVNLETPLSPYGWYPWHATLWYGWNRQLKPGGTVEEFRVRAFDALGRSQPDDGSVHWNPSGYEWYGVDSVKVNLH